MEPIVSIQKLNKRYGKIQAVDNLNLDIEKGNIYGILGPNGSGKTTTLGILLGVINADSGSFRWFNRENSKHDRKKIGAILEQPIFYPYLTAEKNLEIIAGIKEVSTKDIDRVLEAVELSDRRKSKFRTYSYGMKQRLAIAAALLGNPEVLIFDEPTNGLDPKGIAEIRELILQIAEGGITIILASHLLDEVQKICSHVAVLRKGKKLFSGRVDEVLTLSDTIELAAPDIGVLENVLKNFEGITEVNHQGNLIIAKLNDHTNSLILNSFLVSKGIVVTHLALKKKSLEQQFLELLKESE